MKKSIFLLFIISMFINGASKRELSVFNMQERERKIENAQIEAIKNNKIISEEEKSENENEETLFEDEKVPKKKLKM